MIQAFLFLIPGIKLLCFYCASNTNIVHSIICLSLLFFFFGKFISYVGYRFSMADEENSIKMKWKTIKDIYIVNPSRWSYYRYNGHDYRHLVYDNRTTIILSFFAYQSLLFHIRKQEYKHKKIAKNKRLREVLESAQRDIDIKKAEAHVQINTARTINDTVRQNLIDEYISKYIHKSGGKLPDWDSIALIARKFNCSIDDILDSIHRVLTKEF